MSVRQTHTYAILEISQSVYDEIHRALDKAGYQHALVKEGLIDMAGIAVTVRAANVCVCDHVRTVHLSAGGGRCTAAACQCESFRSA